MVIFMKYTTQCDEAKSAYYWDVRTIFSQMWLPKDKT